MQTLTFDSITTRRGTWTFPDNGDTYRKILMQYTLKCDPATTADPNNCGEWDYLTYNNIFDHTGNMDSTALEHPWFLVGGEEPAEADYSLDPAYSWHQSQQTEVVISSVISETLDTLGLGASTSGSAIGGAASDGRTQYLWTAAELTASGMVSGDIDRIMLNVQSAGPELRHLTVRMRTTAGGLNSTFFENGWNEVYHLDTDFPSTGWQALDFHTPFFWNGTSNILVEFSYDNSAGASMNNEVAADDLGTTAGLEASGSDNYVWFDAANWVGVPTSGLAPSISEEITVAFWQYGDPDVQAQNDYSFEGYDSDGRRVVNVHLPWSNSRVYWDAGNEGGSYDRIDKLATDADFEGQWNHWAFTKDATTGTMKIFLNGVQWHQGGGRTRLMDDITTFNIGANGANGGNYDGGMDEFCVFNKALIASEIEELMLADIAPAHPQYANLVAYYQFDEGTGINAANSAGTADDASLIGAPQWRNHGGHELFRNASETTMRPQVIFAMGDYTSTTNTNTVTDTVMLTPNTIVYYEVDGNDVVGIDTVVCWIQQWQYTYDATGNKIDSIQSGATNAATNSVLNYFSAPFEVIDRYEIGRYITPYGLGLDLGPEGTTWYYDVTDYAPLLRGEVDMNAGNNQELIDVKFLMIKGTPPRDVKEINRIWGARASYSYAALDNNDQLAAQTVELNPAASTYKVRTRLTGHGHNSTTGNYPHCCEWKDNEHYLYVNSSQVAAWHIWQASECANNPVYPQGGTWPGAREGWCPGDVVKNFDFDITEAVTGSSVTLDYDLTPVPSNNQGMGSGNYVVAMQLMQYGDWNAEYDAEIYDVLSPTDADYYARNNPYCTDAKVVLRNNGSVPLTYCRILYGTTGGTPAFHDWTGSLVAGDTVHVTLPIGHESFWDGDGSLQFFATVKVPNDEVDENPDNDTHYSTYTKPDFYEESITVEIRANNYPAENRIRVIDIDENVVYERDDWVANQVYSDDLNLGPGCYTLILEDDGLDGLSYWADQSSGNGYLRLRDMQGGFLKFFESEFGGYIRYGFSIGLETTVPELTPERNVAVYPNPNNGVFTVEALGYDQDFKAEVLNATGQVVATNRMQANVLARADFDLSDQAPGLYMVRLQSATETVTKHIVVR